MSSDTALHTGGRNMSAVLDSARISSARAKRPTSRANLLGILAAAVCCAALLLTVLFTTTLFEWVLLGLVLIGTGPSTSPGAPPAPFILAVTLALSVALAVLTARVLASRRTVGLALALDGPGTHGGVDRIVRLPGQSRTLPADGHGGAVGSRKWSRVGHIPAALVR